MADPVDPMARACQARYPTIAVRVWRRQVPLVDRGKPAPRRLNGRTDEFRPSPPPSLANARRTPARPSRGVSELGLEPVAGQLHDLFQRAWLLEEMCRAWDQLQGFVAGQFGQGAPIELDDLMIGGADDEQGGRGH